MRACPVLTVLFAALQAVGLGACDKLTSTTIVRTMDDGSRHDKSWSKTWKDRAEFRCIASSSGHCHVVVFTSDCPGRGCTTRVLSEWTLPAGTSRKLTQPVRWLQALRDARCQARRPHLPESLRSHP